MNNKSEELHIRIYVACLAAYNNGYLHGAWIDATQSCDDIKADIVTMLKNSPVNAAEEYAIHDYEGFEGAGVNEHDSIKRINRLAHFVAEHGTLGAELFNHFGEIDAATEAIQDRYTGCFETIAEFAEQLTEETGEVPDHLRFYIDYDKMAHDMEINDLLVIETGHQQVHVFWQQ